MKVKCTFWNQGSETPDEMFRSFIVPHRHHAGANRPESTCEVLIYA
jgi:hypothetical protein